jgi:hypothetical protein
MLQGLFQVEGEGPVRLAVALDLEEPEIDFLLGEKATKATMKKFLAAMDAAQGGKAAPEPEPEPEPEPVKEEKAEPAEPAKQKQKALFEF